MHPREILRNHLAKEKLRTHAELFLDDLLIDMGSDDNKPGDGAYTYDDSKGRAERYMLAGNGPSAWVVFVEFAPDDVTGYLEYADGDGTTTTYIPEPLVSELRTALRADAKERKARR